MYIIYYIRKIQRPHEIFIFITFILVIWKVKALPLCLTNISSIAEKENYYKKLFKLNNLVVDPQKKLFEFLSLKKKHELLASAWLSVYIFLSNNT